MLGVYIVLGSFSYFATGALACWIVGRRTANRNPEALELLLVMALWPVWATMFVFMGLAEWAWVSGADFPARARDAEKAIRESARAEVAGEGDE